MPQPDAQRAVTRDRYDAVLLDLDGVVTDTASIHAACWKQMFDEYLQNRAMQRGEAFRPFDLAADYRLYVDGKPRFDGVRDFLASAISICLREAWTILPRQKQCAGSGSERMILSTRSSKREVSNPTKEVSNSSASCVVKRLRSQSSLRARTAPPF